MFVLGFSNDKVYLNIHSKTIVRPIEYCVKPNVVKLSDSDIKWNRLIESIIYVESRNDSTVIGEKKNAVGVLQITPVYVYEVNRILEKSDSTGVCKHFNLSDRFSKCKSIEMFNIYQNKKNPKRKLRLAIKLHNPKSYDSYADSVMQKYKELKHIYKLEHKGLIRG
jgi:hypothetical protein